MKNLIGIIGFIIVMIFLSACKKDKRRSGVCYCEFVKGDDQQYDLTDKNRQEQIDACNTHDNNAGKFGGHCELE